MSEGRIDPAPEGEHLDVCPFCIAMGSASRPDIARFETEIYSRDPRRWWQVKCGNCGMCGPNASSSGLAVKFWNDVMRR